MKKNKKEKLINFGFGIFCGGTSYTLFHYIPDMAWFPVLSIIVGLGMVIHGLKND